MIELIIDENIRKLIPSTPKNEIKELTKNIQKNGCLEPIVIWKDKNIIIDGFERYKICKKYNIEFNIKPMEFYCIEDVEYYILISLLYNKFKKVNFTDYSAYARYKFLMKYMQRIVIDINNKEKWCEPLNLRISKSTNIIRRDDMARILSVSIPVLINVIKIDKSNNEELKEKLYNNEVSSYGGVRKLKETKETNETDIINVNAERIINDSNSQFILHQIDDKFRTLRYGIEDILNKLIFDEDVNNNREIKLNILKMLFDNNELLKQIIDKKFKDNI